MKVISPVQSLLRFNALLGYFKEHILPEHLEKVIIFWLKT